MELGYDRDVYMLAFDHRGSFTKGLFGIQGTPTPGDIDRVADAKRVIWEGYQEAVAEGALHGDTGILVDEEFGADVARTAQAQGAVLAMPVEKSGQEEFDFEFGDAFGDHVEAFDPTFAKVLVRYNPEGDAALNARQAERLARLGDWLHQRGRRFLFELLVPPTKQQLAAAGDQTSYDLEVRPGLMRRTIAVLQEAGVEPDIWKIEGIDRVEDCEAIAAQARAGGRDGVACIVLGRGANDEKVAHWLRTGAEVEGYRGFAIGRTIWWDALAAFRDGSIDRSEAAERIAGKYLNAIAVYRANR